MNHSKNVDFYNVFNQLTFAYKKIDVELKQILKTFISNIIVEQFMNQLKKKRYNESYTTIDIKFTSSLILTISSNLQINIVILQFSLMIITSTTIFFNFDLKNIHRFTREIHKQKIVFIFINQTQNIFNEINRYTKTTTTNINYINFKRRQRRLNKNKSSMINLLRFRIRKINEKARTIRLMLNFKIIIFFDHSIKIKNINKNNNSSVYFFQIRNNNVFNIKINSNRVRRIKNNRQINNDRCISIIISTTKNIDRTFNSFIMKTIN